MLEKLRSRAHHTYSTYCATVNGCPGTLLPLNLPDIHDLSAFGGTKGAVINKSPLNSPHGSNAPSPDSTVSGEIPANSSAHSQHSSHSPHSLSSQSSLAYSSDGSSPPHQPDAMAQISFGSNPSTSSVLEEVQFGLSYSAAQDATPTQRAPDFRPPTLFVPQEQTLLPLEDEYVTPTESTQFPLHKPAGPSRLHSCPCRLEKKYLISILRRWGCSKSPSSRCNTVNFLSCNNFRT
jgi:hypothetical protein